MTRREIALRMQAKQDQRRLAYLEEWVECLDGAVDLLLDAMERHDAAIALLCMAEDGDVTGQAGELESLKLQRALGLPPVVREGR